MPLIPIHSIDDPRVLAYRDLPRSRLPRRQGLFIAEGGLLVERLLASGIEVVSLLVDEQHRQWAAQRAPQTVPILVTPRGLVRQIIGFNFHRGILACGRQPPPVPIAKVIPDDNSPRTIVIAAEVQDPENLGGLLRNCAAFGVDAVLLSPACADPFSRRVLRVSMGTVFQLPLAVSNEFERELEQLRAVFGFQLACTVLDASAESLDDASRPPRLALLFGNEAHGVHPRWQQMCDRHLTIPMHAGTDSLNVAVASGIFLYHFTRCARVTAEGGSGQPGSARR